MPSGANWIPRELKRLQPDRYSRAGFDVNEDGELSADERIATYNKNTIPGNDPKVIGDWADWVAFYRAHSSNLADLGGIFKYSTKFKPTNPIHYATAIESPMSSLKEIAATYIRLAKILERFRTERKVRVASHRRTYSPLGLMRITIPSQLKSVLLRYAPSQRNKVRQMVIESMALQRVLQKQGYRRTGRRAEVRSVKLITRGLMICTQSTLIPLTIGHEYGWPIYPVPAPGHVFPRWDNKKEGKERIALNVEFLTRVAAFPTDAEERRINRNPSLETLGKTTYLKTHGDEYTIAMHIMHRGLSWMYMGKVDRSINDLKTAAKLIPTVVEPLVNLAVAYLKKGKHEKAFEFYRKAEALDGEATRIYLGRSLAYKQLGMIARARRSAQLALYYGSKLSSKIPWLANNLPKWKAYPHIYADTQVRIGKGTDATAADGRIGLGLRWNLGQLYKNFGLGFLASVGFGFGGKSSTADITAGLSLTVESQRSSLAFDLGVGYNAVMSGDPSAALVRKGGLVMAGLRYHYEIGDHVGLGLNLLIQGEMGGRRGVAVLPGVQLTYDF